MIHSYNIYNEDCFETMKRFQDGSIDLILTSPPYNMTKRKGGNADTGRYDVYEDWKTEQDYLSFTLRLFNDFDRILNKNKVVLYNFSYSIENPSLPYKIVTEIESKTPFALVDTIVWKKKSGMPFPANERRLSRNWEFVWVFSRKSEMDTFDCHKGVSSVSEATGQKYYNIFYNLIEAKNSDCATPKLNQATYSTEFCLKLMDVYCGDGYRVYDPFLGTGTTANACRFSPRKDLICYGSELSKNQCEYAEKRLNDGSEDLLDILI